MTFSVVDDGRSDLLIDLAFPSLKDFLSFSEVDPRVHNLQLTQELVLIIFTSETVNDSRHLILVALNDLLNIINEVLIDV
jgi:hypothetical protein